MKTFIFGLGYSALHFAQTYRAHFDVVGTVTSQEKAQALRQSSIACHVYSGAGFDEDLRKDLLEAEALVVSVPPMEQGDLILRDFAQTLAQCRKLKSIVYLSTVGVYGDHKGGFVDEASLCVPVNSRSQQRLKAEADWLALGAELAAKVSILRLAGIYGAGQNAFVALANGTARRIIKQGQVFNRIHVDDIAGSIKLCLLHDQAQGVWNVCDDLPSPPQDVVTLAAQIMGVAPPPEIAFEEAQMSPMARSFYGECKRVSNQALKSRLGWQLIHPTYQEALASMWRADNWR